jgi:YD repeat-containing protein
MANLCLSCRFELIDGAPNCPACGLPAATDLPGHARRWHRVALIGALSVVALSVLVLRAWPELWRSRPSVRPDVTAAAMPYRSQHGAIVAPACLRGSGTIYFVPVGKADLSLITDLAGYFKTKLGLNISILPPVTDVKLHQREASNFWPVRWLDSLRSDPYKAGQLWVEEVLDQLPRANPDIVRDPGAILIGITSDDIAPRDFSWNFTYSWRKERRYALVSDARMGLMPDGSRDGDTAVTDLRKMVMKNIGVLYYKLPLNNDPTSLLYKSIDLYRAGEDFYQSDLQPELAPWGRHGSTDPCLTLVYDYSKSTVEPAEAVGDCDPESDREHTSREKFTLDLRYGLFIARKTDFLFKDSPPILFRRVYRTREVWDRAFGWGASHSYNSFLTTKSHNLFTDVHLVFEDGGNILFRRKSFDVWFTTFSRFQADVDGEYRRAELTWDGDLFHLKRQDGSSYTYLPCGGTTPCYLIGYRDAQGKRLEIKRDGYLNLEGVKSANSRLDFLSDAKRHIIRAADHLGNEVRYEHNANGDVSAVRYPSGHVVRYTYDIAHQMLTASVEGRERAAPIQLFENEYDSDGRIVRHKQANGMEYRIYYRLHPRRDLVETIVTDSSGAVTRLRYGSGSDYSLWYQPSITKQ